MDPRTLAILVGKELRDARRNRWFLVLTALFASLSLALSAVGLAGLGTIGVSGFGRTTASLLNLVLLIVPLMGLLMGALSIAGEREQGTLGYVLAQPVTTGEVFAGKVLGLGTALAGSVSLGFGLSALLVARSAGLAQVSGYLTLVALTWVLGLIFLVIGLGLSAVSPRHSTAVGLAVVAWLVAVFFSDVGVMGTAVALRLDPRQILWLSLANPTQIFKLASLQALQGHLEMLGPGALYAARALGPWWTPVLAALLVAWVVAPLGVALRLFRARGGL